MANDTLPSPPDPAGRDEALVEVEPHRGPRRRLAGDEEPPALLRLDAHDLDLADAEATPSGADRPAPERGPGCVTSGSRRAAVRRERPLARAPTACARRPPRVSRRRRRSSGCGRPPLSAAAFRVRQHDGRLVRRGQRHEGLRGRGFGSSDDRHALAGALAGAVRRDRLQHDLVRARRQGRRDEGEEARGIGGRAGVDLRRSQKLDGGARRRRGRRSRSRRRARPGRRRRTGVAAASAGACGAALPPEPPARPAGWASSMRAVCRPGSPATASTGADGLAVRRRGLGRPTRRRVQRSARTARSSWRARSDAEPGHGRRRSAETPRDPRIAFRMPSRCHDASSSNAGTFLAFKPFIFRKATAIRITRMLYDSPRELPAPPGCPMPEIKYDLRLLRLRLRRTIRSSSKVRRHWAAAWPSTGIGLVYGGGNVGLMGTVARVRARPWRPCHGHHSGFPEIPRADARRRAGDHRRPRHAHPQAADVREARTPSWRCRAASARWRSSSSR